MERVRESPEHGAAQQRAHHICPNRCMTDRNKQEASWHAPYFTVLYEWPIEIEIIDGGGIHRGEQCDEHRQAEIQLGQLWQCAIPHLWLHVGERSERWLRCDGCARLTRLTWLAG